jgi:hypothetical protein
MSQANNSDKLDVLFRAYKRAHPDADPGPDFMPGLWRRIEGERKANSSWLVRWLEVCLATTMAAALLLGFYVIPKFQEPASNQIASQTSYLDVLADADSAGDTSILMNVGGELE